jgi:anti-anti-sigma factor
VPTASVSTPEPATALRAPQFSCLRSNAGSAKRVTVAGELDIATLPQLDDALRRAQADAAVVVVDVRKPELLDRCGAHLLPAADRRLRQAGGRLIVVRGHREVESFREPTGLDRELELVDQPPTAGGAPAMWDGGPT